MGDTYQANIWTTIQYMLTKKEAGVTFSQAKRMGRLSYNEPMLVHYANYRGHMYNNVSVIGAMGCDRLSRILSDANYRWTRITDGHYKRGDLFILGVPGNRSGNAGHCGYLYEKKNVDSTDDTAANWKCIRMDKVANGVLTTETLAELLTRFSNPPMEVYRNNLAVDIEGENPLETYMGEIEKFYVDVDKETNDVYLHIVGWQWSSYNPTLRMEVWKIADNDSEDDTLLWSQDNVPRQERVDIADKYQDIPNIINCGFDLKLKIPDDIPNNVTIYVVGTLTGASDHNLNPPEVLAFEEIYTVSVGNYVAYDERASEIDGLLIEYVKPGTDIVTHRFYKVLDDISWGNELNTTPSTTLRVRNEDAAMLQGNEEVKIYIHDKLFHGIIAAIKETQGQTPTVDLDIDHIISEWERTQMATNILAYEYNIKNLLADGHFLYVPNWNALFREDLSDEAYYISYLYSRQTRLQALNQTVKMTPDLYWRVGFDMGRSVEIGKFGQLKPYVFQTGKPRRTPSGVHVIQILDTPVVSVDLKGVYNRLVVYSDRADGGMSSVTLRDLYLSQFDDDGNFIAEKTLPGFPIGIHDGVNTDTDVSKRYTKYIKLASNDELEYYVDDLESIEIEGGIIRESTVSFNDYSPFSTNMYSTDEAINYEEEGLSDEDRAKASLTVYERAVHFLRNHRRIYEVSFNCTAVDFGKNDINVGDIVNLQYDVTALIKAGCSDYLKQLLNMNDTWYIKKLEYNFKGSALTETNNVTLAKYIYMDREYNKDDNSY